MQWQTEYPTIAMVNEAAFTTLDAWDRSLPAPQTDVEHAVRRRIKKCLLERAGEELRKTEPGIADQFNDVFSRMDKLFGTKSPRF